jgi:hypothetical protein
MRPLASATLLAAVLACPAALAAPAPFPRPVQPADGVFEIDLAPLAGLPDDTPAYRLTIAVKAKGFSAPYVLFSSSFKPGVDDVVGVLVKDETLAWSAYADPSTKRVKVKPPRGVRFLSVEVHVRDLDPIFTPAVRRLLSE